MVSAIFRPGKAMRKLLESRRPVRRAALSIVGAGVLYGVTSVVLAITGAVPTAPVFFGIDVDTYYFWQMAFVLPLILAVWLLASGVLLFPGRRKSGGPGFGGTAGLVGVALGAFLAVAWVPTCIFAVFMTLGMGQEEWASILSDRGPWQTAYLVWYAGAAVRAVRDFILAARLVGRKSWTGAVLTGITAAAVAIGAYVVFIR